MKRITVGILAHVDAGKTTLSEGLLYSSGVIDKLGRVDKRDAYLDTYSLERERGITIFSKQAILSFGNTEITLVDTPGHIDFSCEAERSLSVQDYAILVISAQDGIQAHTKTLWKLLEARKIPTFIFVNKTDISERMRQDLIAEIKTQLSQSCVDFSSADTNTENIAASDEALIREYFDTGSLSTSSIASAIKKRSVFPCFFGSALKMTGVREFLSEFDKYTLSPEYNERLFGARIYKISRDKSGKRLTYMKITGGVLRAKDILKIRGRDFSETEEKVEEIRIYSGEKYKSVREAKAGSLCAVSGLSATEVGMGLGFEANDEILTSPVLDYKMILPKDVSVYEAYLKFMALKEEDPSLSLSYNERTREISVRLMGEIQTEVLKRIISERFGLSVDFGEGSILYKETIKEAVRGAGHFEPLRHYAEVHLLLEPLPEGSGIVSASDCPADTLLLNWQRLIITHIEEKLHRGVLTASPLTDVKITLLAGKAHQKHTEGGDFRQATYRAIRQALMKAESVLLEPTFDFRIELPQENLGRAMNDLSAMYAVTNPPEFTETTAVLTGVCPVLTMRSYATELRAYTRGEGKITMTVGKYVPCHNADEVIAKIGYNPELDERNTPNSVFCKGGSGYVVPWNEADGLMHVSLDGEDKTENTADVKTVRAGKLDYRGTVEEDKELMRIFESTYGKIKPRQVSERVENSAEPSSYTPKPKKQKQLGTEHILIDGYNFIFANEELRRLADGDISLARDTLTRIMCDYASIKRCKVIIVFDAYKRRGGEGSQEIYGPVSVVYTKEAETADAFIERTTRELSDSCKVRVVTSDMQEQLVVLGFGGLRVSAREFAKELVLTEKEIKEIIDSLK